MKKTEKYIQRFFLILAGVIGVCVFSILVFSLIGSDDSDKIDYSTEMTEEKKTEAYKEEYMSDYEDDEDDNFESVEASDSPTIEETTKDLEESFTKLIQNSFGTHADVRFHEDSKTFFILPVSDDLILQISDYAEYGVNAEEWDSMKQNLMETSELIEDTLGQGYSIKMPNPSDISRILIEIKDGGLVKGI